MAICFWEAKLFWSAYLDGVSFDNIATIGHQSLYLHPSEVDYFRNVYQNKFSSLNIDPLKDYHFGSYSDEFLVNFLKVKQKTIIDGSNYEGAGTILDLNLPIPKEMHNRFDVVLDCGTLEHIFNFTVAINNLMSMVKVGGTLFLSNPSNNLSGHGFFQFSPELMFRTFSKENGYKLIRLVITEGVYPSVEQTPHGRAYDVVDPKEVQSRVLLQSKSPVMMIVQAARVADAPIFKNYPIQSDYASLWATSGGTKIKSRSSLREVLRNLYQRTPLQLRLRISGMLQKKEFSLSNKKYFKKLDDLI